MGKNVLYETLIVLQVFFLVRMCVREGGGGKEGKVRVVTYARFSFPVRMQLLFK